MERSVSIDEILRSTQDDIFMKGKLIVIEGSDGAGKSTQLELLKKYLEEQKLSVLTQKFPQYKEFFGSMIAAYLRGEYGELSSVNPYLISVIYALDRGNASEKMNQDLADGKIIVLDRYAPSNMAHQTGRMSKDKRETFLRWVEELEYQQIKIPREDIVIYLHIPYQISQNLILDKSRSGREYAKGRQKDIVEEDLEYLKNSEEAYVDLAKRFPHWVMVECVDKKGNLRSREEIHEVIITILKEKKILFSP